MPLYEYNCDACGRACELLVRSSDRPVCPHCGSDQIQKQWSVPAAPGARGVELPIQSGGMCGRSQCAQGGCQGLE